MIRNKTASLLGGLALALPLAASAQFVDNFGSDTSGNYSINKRTHSTYEFGWDYSTAGIPAAPNTTDGSTLGLRTIPNGSTTVGNDAITFIPNYVASGNVTMQFDIWMNFVGPLAGGGSGSTEFAMVGAGISSFNLNGTPKEGTWLGVNGDGFGDYRMYQSDIRIETQAGVFPGGPTANGTYYLGDFPGGIAAPAVQGGSQTGVTDPGALGFAWHVVTMERIGTTTTWTIDGLLIATVENAANGADNVFFGHWDHANGVANSTYQYHVIDNLSIIPEPSTYAAIFGGLALVGAFAHRRRKNRV